MIPAAYITDWANGAPWPSRQQIEQDLVLSRLIVEIARDTTLGPELALRGGTCLHKLHLNNALRYSEDLDYVRTTKSGIKPYLSALRVLTERVGLREKSTTRSGQMVHFVCEAPAEDGGAIVVKIEVNITETKAVLPRVQQPFAVRSRWFDAETNVPTFQLEELLATKLRALYQRRKGRDLFDLWHVLTTRQVDDDAVVATLRHYMPDTTFTFPELRDNLTAKLAHPDFRADLTTLVVDAPENYELTTAADLVMQRLGARLDNAPDHGEIAAGAWRHPHT